jgi:hypothetical protein
MRSAISSSLIMSVSVSPSEYSVWTPPSSILTFKPLTFVSGLFFCIRHQRLNAVSFSGNLPVIGFTSGGSESNNHAIKGTIFRSNRRNRRNRNIITARIDHQGAAPGCGSTPAGSQTDQAGDDNGRKQDSQRRQECSQHLGGSAHGIDIPEADGSQRSQAEINEVNVVDVRPAQDDIATYGNTGSGMDDFQGQRPHERQQEVYVNRSDNPVDVYALVAKQQLEIDENEYQRVGDAYDILQDKE